jgi:hypothetical protein
MQIPFIFFAAFTFFASLGVAYLAALAFTKSVEAWFRLTWWMTKFPFRMAHWSVRVGAFMAYAAWIAFREWLRS